MEKNLDCVNDLMKDVKLMVDLCSTFPPLCGEEEDKRKGQELVESMRSSERVLNDLFRSYVPGRPINQQTAKEIADHLRNALERLVDVTHVMEDEQIKRILRAIKRSFEVVVLMKDTTNDFRFEQKAETYRKNIDALIKLIDTRIEAIDDGEDKIVLAESIARVKERQESLISTTSNVTRNPTQDNLAAQQDDLKVMLMSIQGIASIIQKGGTQSKAKFDHNMIIGENLDHLADAINAGSAGAAADAARKIADEIERMRGDYEPPKEDDGRAAAARKALDDSCDRLRKMTQNLVKATKDALQNPTPDNKGQVQKVMSDMKKETAAASNPRRFDTVNTGLKSSGMIEAAAKAAQQLQHLFQE